MKDLALILIGIAVAFVGYTYLGYPLLLKALAWIRGTRPAREPAPQTPRITITLAAYNEAAAIRGTLENLLALDYPAERRQVLVISDASTDNTDEIVAEFADRGVQLLRLPQRSGKTAAENAALEHVSGDIIVNTDASVRVERNALRHLIAAFDDPSVGLASGRDVSVANLEGETNLGESDYVGYEMWLREQETRVWGIIGASGCFYAIRADLHRSEIPAGLSRDFAAALYTREQGFRSVSVNEARCFVPRAASLRTEYPRKVRTLARGLRTLFYKRALLNPFRYGLFAWMLISHKLCRWLVPWALALGLLGVVLLGALEPWGVWLLGAVALGLGAAVVGWVWPGEGEIGRILALPAYLAAGNLAALHAWIRVLRRRADAVWEPTRRGSRGAFDAS
ncbi:MAG: glycosyltransferase family 2 protein [Gemmatimonadota bacterium]|nr:MAG: glycosyltransferase family 2 protein [Gemmatimonadota bacterium]